MANLLASRAQIERLLEKHPKLNYDVANMIADKVERSRNADTARVRELVNRRKTRRARQQRERTMLAHETRRQHRDPDDTLTQFADFVDTMKSIDKIYGYTRNVPNVADANNPFGTGPGSGPGVNPFGSSGRKARKTRGKKRGRKNRK